MALFGRQGRARQAIDARRASIAVPPSSGPVSGIGQMVQQAQSSFKSPFARSTPPSLQPLAQNLGQQIKEQRAAAGGSTFIGGATPAVEPTVRDSIPAAAPAIANAASAARFQREAFVEPVADPAVDVRRGRQFSDNANFARGRFNR